MDGCVAALKSQVFSFILINMKRTKFNNSAENPISYSVQDEPIVISKVTLDIFLKQKRPADLIALYTFYYYTAKWQQTNQPKATDAYCMKGLEWGEKRLIGAKKKLIALGFIKPVKEKNKASGQITGFFIRINFIWNINKPQSPQKPFMGTKTPVPSKAVSGFQETNALITNNRNALITNTRTPKISIKERNKKYLPLATQLSEIIQTKKNITHTSNQIKQWSNEIRRLVEESKVDYNRVETALNWYSNNIGGTYIPVIESGASLREKFIRLESAMEKDGYSDTQTKFEWYKEDTEIPDRVKKLNPNYSLF